MSVKRVFRASSPVAIAVLLASCGGGMTDLGSEPVIGGASGVTDLTSPSEEENSGAESGTAVSGRVADGYIQGATVCVDLNNSDTCDADEPSALTGSGGSYQLTIPVGAEDKPIVANIPAEAIDEDTGEAIGKALVFVAPADQPEFISPITTLVHQELQSNPTLELEDAENAVKSLLGVAEQDVSLFTDYVAAGNDDNVDGDSQSSFRYLHDTARVVTSMMKDIETQVEAAAQSTGMDVVGSEDTQRAIRDIVRREVKQLLPDIARQVAAIVSSEASTSAELDTETEVGTDVTTAFDPDRIALALRPENVGRDVEERIEAVVERVEPVETDIRQALNDGVYWMEFDCYFDDYDRQQVDQSEDISREIHTADSTLADDVDETTYVEYSQHCEPFYGKVQLNAAGDELISQEFTFDSDTRGWMEALDEDDMKSHHVLVNGQWQESISAESGPQGAVEFMADGSAVINNAEGVMELKAVTHSLDALEVRKHIISGDEDPLWLERVQATDLFTSGALAHKISVKQTLHPYVLFNTNHYTASGEVPCTEYFDNCNVIGNKSADHFYAMRTLNEIREGAVQGIDLVATESSLGPDAVMSFTMDGEYDGTLPISGMVAWSFGYHNYGEEPGFHTEEHGDSTLHATYPSDKAYADECYVPGIPYPEDVDEVLPEYLQVEKPDFSLEPVEVLPVEEQDPEDRFTRGEELNDVARNELTVSPYKEESDDIYPQTGKEGCVDPAVQTGQYYQPEESDSGGKPVLSRWKLVKVDGVELIEIQMPEIYRFDGDRSEAAMLLAVHDDYVRAGVRTAGSYVDRVTTYNEAAFTTLRGIIESTGNNK